MIPIEATRRVSRRAVERIRDAFLEYDSVIYRRLEVDPKPEDCYVLVHDGKTWVLAIDDPSIEWWQEECGG